MWCAHIPRLVDLFRVALDELAGSRGWWMDPNLADTQHEPAAQGAGSFGVAVELAAAGFDGAVEVGRGGFGTVYRCIQVALDRVVAVKVLTVVCQEDQARFVREQQAMATLTAHPNIMAVLQVGQTASGNPFLVMPYCGSGCWQERIARVGTLDIEEVSRVGVKIAGALECAHRAGIIHRDVKPANILSTDYGQPALSDFGIARTKSGFKTATGVFQGSPAFTAPELFGDAAPSEASDVYGLGASLFTGLTGHAAFERRHGEQLMAQFVRIASQHLPDLRERGIPADFAAIIEQAMAHDPNHRPSALELGQELQLLQARHGLNVDDMVLHDRASSDRSHNRISRSSRRGRGKDDSLPSPLKALVGRAAELIRLRELLECSRLVTVTGTGGVGKTSLAMHAAHQLSADHPDAVWRVDLGDVPDGSQLAGLVAATLGVANQPTQASIETLIEVLDRRWALILLDNCEQVVNETANLVDTLLRHCPRLHILATSREVLAVGGEAVLSLSPLDCPSPQDEPSVEDLAGYDAVTLFVECARAAVPEFALTEHTAAAVAGICARVDGLPLGIELAATRLPAMPVEQIADGLRDGYALLSVGGATDQRSLAYCIDRSYDLCTQDEQQVWARLSLFAGNFDLSAAQYVSGADLPASEFLDLLSTLVDKSILIRTENDGIACYRLLETLRDYGLGRITSDERTRLARRHAAWYHQVLSEAEDQWFGPQQLHWILRLTRELPNIREALQFSLTDCPEMAVEMAAAIRRFWIQQAMVTEGCQWANRALAATSPKPSVQRIRALFTAAHLAFQSGDTAMAMDWLADARNLFQFVEGNDDIARTMSGTAGANLHAG